MFNKAWTGGARAYDEADTVEAALAAYRRCRTDKHFILRGDVAGLTCSGCGRDMADDPADLDSYKGNRAVYHAKTKTVSVRHYTCAWGALLTEVAKIKIGR